MQEEVSRRLAHAMQFLLDGESDHFCGALLACSVELVRVCSIFSAPGFSLHWMTHLLISPALSDFGIALLLSLSHYPVDAEPVLVKSMSQSQGNSAI